MPSGTVYCDGSIFFAGLSGASLYEAVLSATKVIEVKRHLQREFGRLRTAVAGPDGYLYILTNNRDGRGNAAPDDDIIIRINPGRGFVKSVLLVSFSNPTLTSLY